MASMGRSLRVARPTDLLKLVDARMEPRHRGPDHRLLPGDSLEVLAQLPEASVDLIFADPPYLLSNGGTTCLSGRGVSVHKGDRASSVGWGAGHQSDPRS